MAKNTALDARLFHGTCGTSSQCVPINTPGAESTNNVTRARRLGPRWQGQGESNAQGPRPGVLFEIRSPSKSIPEASGQRRELTTHGDAALIEGVPIAKAVVTMPLRTAASPDPSRSDLGNGTARLDLSTRLRLRLCISLALGALIVLIVLTGIAWQGRAKHTNSSVVAVANESAAAGDVSLGSIPLKGGQVQSTVSVRSEAPPENKADDSADRAPQTRVDRKEHQLPALNSKGFIRPESTTSGGTMTVRAGNNADAPVDLANEYLRSEGVPRGCAKAMPLLKTAAAKGNVRARNRLASMYAIGGCVPRDPVQAYGWLAAALDADPHNQWAQQNRDLMLRQMTTEERSQIRSTE